VVKIGRTHPQDALPLTVGQEWSGLNAPPGFAEEAPARIARSSGHPFRTAANKFAALGGLDTVVAASSGLREFAIEGPRPDRDRIDEHVGRSLMLITALSPVIGDERAAAIAHRAEREGTSPREAALADGAVNAEGFDRIADPRRMTGQP
jgi:fumarate hydratase class II